MSGPVIDEGNQGLDRKRLRGRTIGKAQSERWIAAKRDLSNLTNLPNQLQVLALRSATNIEYDPAALSRPAPNHKCSRARSGNEHAIVPNPNSLRFQRTLTRQERLRDHPDGPSMYAEQSWSQ